MRFKKLRILGELRFIFGKIKIKNPQNIKNFFNEALFFYEIWKSKVGHATRAARTLAARRAGHFTQVTISPKLIHRFSSNKMHFKVYFIAYITVYH